MTAEAKVAAEKPTIATSTGEHTLAKMLKTIVDQPPADTAQADLLGDAFMGAWKPNPKVVDQPAPERAVNHALMSWAMENGLKEKTASTGNIPASLFSASILWTGLTTDSALQEALKTQAESEQCSKNADMSEQNALDCIDKAGKESIPKVKSAAMKEAEDYFEKADYWKKEAKILSESALEEVGAVKGNPVKRQAMAAAIDEAAEGSETVRAMMKGWGIEPGTSQPADVERILNLAKSPSFSKLSELFGRAKHRSVKTIQATKQARGGVVAKVGRTKTVSRLFSGEVLSLSPDSPLPLRARKMRNLVGSGLMGWIPTETLTKQGSFVMAVDESGSIGNDLCEVEKAIALGIAQATRECLETNRKYELFGFAHEVLEGGVTSDDDWRQHMAWASSYHSGGTNIDAALNHALDRIESMQAAGVDAADVVLVSDGIAPIDQITIARLDEAKVKSGVRLAYIHIGHGRNELLADRADILIVTDVENTTQNMEELIDRISVMVARHAQE